MTIVTRIIIIIYDDNDDIVGGASFGAARGWRSFFS